MLLQGPQERARRGPCSAYFGHSRPIGASAIINVNNNNNVVVVNVVVVVVVGAAAAAQPPAPLVCAPSNGAVDRSSCGCGGTGCATASEPFFPKVVRTARPSMTSGRAPAPPHQHGGRFSVRGGDRNSTTGGGSSSSSGSSSHRQQAASGAGASGSASGPASRARRRFWTRSAPTHDRGGQGGAGQCDAALRWADDALAWQDEAGAPPPPRWAESRGRRRSRKRRESERRRSSRRRRRHDGAVSPPWSQKRNR